jgi:predicted RNA-binding Zn-ribbon protein involved in translation (DUF1610 family)
MEKSKVVHERKVEVIELEDYENEVKGQVNMYSSLLSFNCPNCDGLVIVKENEVNCAIFRHGVIKLTGEQMNPHESEASCMYLADNNLINGCGKPIMMNSDRTKVFTCNYV